MLFLPSISRIFVQVNSPMELNSLLIITLIAMLLPAVFGGSCTSSSYYNISERTPPSTVVYRVPRGYSMSSISDRNAASFNKYFNTSNSSVVTVSSTIPLNRNVMALEQGRSILPVTYTLTYINYSASVRPPPCQIVMFYVTGQDNMVPNFTRSAVNFSILEGSGTPSSWPMDLAIDYDEGINSTKNYYIDSPIANATFYLDMTRDSVGAITILQLRRRIAIDREVTSSFNFTIVAEEGRPNALKGYQRIYINVEDVCDFVPAFPITKYQTEAPENTSVSSVVLTVKAIDLDEGRNELMTYSIASQCAKKTLGESCQSGNIYPADGSAPFALDRVSGNLILIQKLDFNKAQEIDLVVLATDACNLVGTAQVQVTVSHVDDKPPTIQVILVSNGAIREDYTLVSDVATVLIMSPVSFSVALIDNSTGLVSDTFYLVTIDSSYRMRLLRSLDSKVQSSYNITIKATDSRNNVAHSTVSITVLAVNHPLVFDNTTAFVSIFDNTANGTVVLRVHASDSDLGGNGMVTYELPPSNATFPYQNNFTIKTTEGYLLVNGALNRKVAKSFILLIKARDNPTNGDPYYSDSMIVNVTLLDPNGNRPIFSIQSSQINVNENTVMETRIIQITSYNPEGVPNGTVIAYGLAPNSAFQIDSVRGWISVVNILNNSATKRYILNVTAYNGFPPPSSFILTINILPGDTVGPVFVPRSYTVQVMRTAAVGSHVVDVKAVDMYSTALRYEIVDGNGDGRFSINPANGTISVLKQLDQSATQTYTLHVKASDPTFYSKWLAEVVINLTTFAFLNKPYTFQVQERLLSGTIVGTISTSLSYTGQVFFTILHSNPDDAFAMDSSNGTITTKKALSAVTGRYTLLIAATYYLSDQSTPTTSIQQMVNITVTKKTGNIQFPQFSYFTTITQSLDIGTAVLNVTITDTSMGIVTYSLISSKPIPFQVDANTGSIYLNAYLDSTPRCTYTFDIVASGYGSQSAVTVSVNIDLHITFDQSQYHVTIPETATKGSVVATIRATGRRGIPIYYYFSNDAPKKYFQIDKVSGDITLLVGSTSHSTTVVKRQSISPIVAMILAQDSQDPSINSTFSAMLTLPTTILQQPAQANPTSGMPLTIIVGAAGGGVLAIAVVFVVVLVALMVRRKRRSAPKVTRAVAENCINSSSNRNSAMLTSFETPNPPPHPQTVSDVVAPKPHTPQSQRSSSKDDITKGEPVYRTSSLKTVPHARSTSDLASTVGTELLSGLEESGPYSKAQLMAIYAANAQLLAEGGSQDSVHMFGSEGGVEVDEVDHMMFGKALQFEEEDEMSVVGEDHSSIQQQDLQEQKDSRFAGKRQWLVSSNGSESDDIPPRYDNMYSQSSSAYSQAYDERMGSQAFHARQAHGTRTAHDQGYYNENEQQWSSRYRLPANERSLSNIYTAPLLMHSAKKALHSSVLEEGPISNHSHHKYSRELTSSDGPLPPNLNILHHHTPLSDSQTDDGNHPNSSTHQGAGSGYYPNSSTHQGAGSGYYYASSSSIASTNLSQTVPRSQNMYIPSL